MGYPFLLKKKRAVEIIRQSLCLQCTLGAAALSLGELSLDDSGKSVSSRHLALPIIHTSKCMFVEADDDVTGK
jgi:hypothetical protein